MMDKPSLTAILLLVSTLAGCVESKPQKSSQKIVPAKVEKHPNESDIYRITLTPEATARLGITTAQIDRKSVQRFRTFAGEITIPSGNTIIVSSPVPGTLATPENAKIPLPGSRIDAGQAIFSLVPLLSPERDVPTPAERVLMANARASLISARIVAEGDMNQSQAEVTAAKIALNRAQRLFRDKVGSQRAVDDAQATLEVASKKLEAAESRKKVLDSLTLEAEKGELKTIQIIAPEHGILRNLTATRGQVVTTGTPLFEIVNLDTVWIRVPVYVGQLDQVVTTADVKIGDLDLRANSKSELLTAKPIAAPPSADPLSSTADLYYEISNRNGLFHPGERVSVRLPVQGQTESLVIPRAAVLHDIHGTAWVYEKTEENIFRRQRVLVRFALDDLAVLASGPAVGTEVVIDGSAELFGTEFGSGK